MISYPNVVFASQTDGTILSGQGYAWSKNIGWINFAAANGNVHVTDTGLTGYAWSQNTGWINLNPTQSGVDNNSEGDLSGYAWGAGLGWINFDNVSINSSGKFTGTASNAIAGTITFDCANCSVKTDWRPASVRSGTTPPPTPTPAPSAASTEPRSIAPTIITFSGLAYPGARIVIIERSFEFGDRPVREEINQSATGAFDITFETQNLFTYGRYGYSALIYDKDGRVSQVKLYPIDVQSQSVTARDILATPTIALTRSLVTRGDSIKVIGYASPEKNVIIEIDQQSAVETKAESSGKYVSLIPTAKLSFGIHSIRARQVDPITKKESDFSPLQQFIVSPYTVVQADLNNDGRIDIQDWSIFLARWPEFGEAFDVSIDLNIDGKNNIPDFSMFLRAFRQR